MNATVAEWYKKHGRHAIYAGGKNVDLSSYEHSLELRQEDVNHVRQRSELPQTARDEKLMRRKAVREATMVREYYEEMVLKKKEKKQENLVQLTQ
jgi:hypothetical protein